MSPSRGRVARTRVLCAVLIPVFLAACSSWRAVGLAPGAFMAADHPAKVRITTRDGTQQVLRGAALAGDTVVGAGEWDRDTVRVALADVTRVDTRAFSSGKTVLLVLGIGALVGLSIAAGSAAPGGIGSGRVVR